MNTKSVVKRKRLVLLLVVLGLFFLFQGFSKLWFYENPDSDYTYADTPVNAYVGGDAYNYIINGTYFTGYSVLAVGSFIIAAIIGVSIPSETNEKTTEQKDNLPRL